MVVVQVPLWILHGNSPSSSSSSSAFAATDPSEEPSFVDKKQKKIQSRLQLWDPSIRFSSANTPKNRSAIYCCDVTCGLAFLACANDEDNGTTSRQDKPDAARLATGGGDGTIKIWRFDALFQDETKHTPKLDPTGGYMSSDESFTTCSTSSSKNKTHSPWQSHTPAGTTHPRFISTLSSHSGSVLTLRFSTFGQYLASGGDDASIFIHLRTYPTPASPQEQWIRLYILRAHNLDVVGLAWAPDDSYLISCSLDSQSPIAVWHVPPHQTPTTASSSWISPTLLKPIKILGKEQHTSTVKGVAFDPAGRYFLSSGDDPAICIWRVEDWTLDRKIDASNSDIFPYHRKKMISSSSNNNNDEDDRDLQALSSLSLFRRISFAPDGSHVCVTNATLRGKNIAAMISRDDHWAVRPAEDGQQESTNHTTQASSIGAANLVGHKQPVVCSRHCPYLFHIADTKNTMDDDDDDTTPVPNYATLVALGDKKGFVTIWSTKKSRPLFKLQCGESQSTVTDMSWGLLPSSKTSEQILALVVALLDGFITVIKFQVPNELYPLLSVDKRNYIFRYKYGIDFNSLSSLSDIRGTKRWVNDKTGPSLIENILPFDMSDQEEDKEDARKNVHHNVSNGYGNVRSSSKIMEPVKVKPTESQQVVEHMKGGKKRIRPVLMTAGDEAQNHMSREVNVNHGKGDTSKSQQKKSSDDPLIDVEKAATIAETINAKLGKREAAVSLQGESTTIEPGRRLTHLTTSYNEPHSSSQSENQIQNREGIHVPIPKEKVFTVDLAVKNDHVSLLEISQPQIIVGSCVNSIEKMPGSNKSVPCVAVSISQSSTITWREMIYGATCTSVASSSNLFAIGTSDGSVYLYSSSPNNGWFSGIGYRSHPPLIFTGAIVRLSCKEKTDAALNGSLGPISSLLVFTSDGVFCVYQINPSVKLVYKGDILAPMNNIRLSVYGGTKQQQQTLFSSSSPQVSRIQLMDDHRLLLLLSSPPTLSSQMIVAGGPLFAFIYDFQNEVWLRVADSRFAFSDFYSGLPGQQFCDSLVNTAPRLLGSIEDVIHCDTGKTPHRKGITKSDYSSIGMYSHTEDNEDGGYLTTRAHCEDRMSCALALGSTNEFLYWLRLYVRNLSSHGSSTHLRFLLHMFLGHELKDGEDDMLMNGGETRTSLGPWWSAYKTACGTEWVGIDIVQKIMLPEMSKNSDLRRLVYEIDTEIKLMR